MNRPLARYRVLHLTTNVPGPVAAARLAQAGAQVTKVEPPTGDALAHVAPEWYRSLHQEQKVLQLDLKSTDGLERFEELLQASDLFLTTTRPQSLEKLKLDWKSVHARHPRLSMLQIQGFPKPRENVAAHDLVCQAQAGLLSPPGLPRALIADFAAAERAFSEALLLLIGGTGAHAAVTLQEAADGFAAAFRAGLTSPEGPLGGALPAYGIYPAKSGWIAFAALEPHFLSRFFQKLGLREDASLGKASRENFEKIFLQKTAVEWEAFGEANDVPLAALL
jgi:crotonobetainyl-CoA:carnitine CoA-transferase CaiB-like acyl-CoA transferase